ncbi:MAG: hypothetical protein JSW51_12060 [Gemmatimonadota bacterium]|nr:MAG: hypothetical protein JSW51_12060 [Gemmatimonadota bacterium]
MRSPVAVTTLLALSLLGSRMDAQKLVKYVDIAAFGESYSFDEGLSLRRISQVTAPLGVDFRIGSFGDLALSTSYVYTRLSPAEPDGTDEELKGLTDTDVRLSVNMLPGRLMLLVGGVIPTGIETVDPRDLTILGAITSDIIGMTTNEMGTGGKVALGVVGAFPVGNFALGLGVTADNSFAYQPVSDTTARLKPGNQLRIRAGFEGPLARRTYLRFAGLVAVRGKDEVDGSAVNTVGNRFTGYLSLNQAIGSTSLIFYGFDVYRADPQLETTAVGSAYLPPGNLLAAGLRWDVPVATAWYLTPRAEFRNSHLAPLDNPDAPLELAGRSLRAGADIGRQFGRIFSLALQGDGITGFVVQEDAKIGFSGFRVALHGQFVF